MSENYEFEDLLGQYAVEAGRYLPRRKRKDIQLEILSLLEDSIEDASEQAGREPDEEMVIEVLKDLGPPITFAENYRQRDYLVGPAIFPLFKPVLIFGLGIFLIQFLVGLILSLKGGGGVDFLSMVDNFFDMGFQTLGVLVFAFALLERTMPEKWLRWPFREMELTWDPKGLLANKSKKAVRIRDIWFEVVFLGGFAVFLVNFPHYVGVGVNRDGVWGFVPTLSENFALFQPWIIAYLLAKLVFNIALARRSYWDSQMRWISVGIRAVGFLLLIALISGPDMFGINPSYLALHNPSASLRQFVESGLPAWNTGFRIYLAIQLVIQFVLLGRDIFRITRGQRELKLNLQ